MRRAIALSGFLSMLTLAAASFIVLPNGPSRANIVNATFLIPASEGYGVGDCLTDASSACGQVVANAWCEAQGFASAGSFGVAAQDEYTGAIETAPVTKRVEAPIRITCQD